MNRLSISTKTETLVLALLLGALPGCQVIDTVPDSFTADLPTGRPVRSTIDEKQSGKLCLSTANALLAEGHDAKAAVLYEKARRHDSKLKVSHPLANAYARLEMPDRAVQEFERAIRESPRDANRLNDFGCYYLRQGELAKAEPLLRGALEQQADHPQAIMNLGECHLRSGRTEEGIELFAQHLGYAAAYSNAGVVLAGLGQTEEAKGFLRQALDQSPELPAARALLAELDNGPTADNLQPQ